MRASPLSLLLLGLLGLVASPQASAAPGDHIRVGDVTITPEVDVGVEYRTNAFRTDQQPQGATAVRIAPGIQIGGETPAVAFQFDGEYALRQFVQLGNPADLPDEQIRAQRKNLARFNEFSLGGQLTALRNRRLGFTIEDRAVLRNNPSDVDIDSDDPYATQIRNTLEAGIEGRPGPALTTKLTGAWTRAGFYIPSEEDQRSAVNRKDEYNVRAGLKYLFLPRTAFVANLRYRVNDWGNETPSFRATELAVPDSQGFTGDAGIQGPITERLKLIARVGFGAQIYRDGPSLTPGQGVLLTLQGDYLAAEGQTVTAGYRKNFTDSFFANSLSYHALYARWSAKWGTRVTSSVEGGLRFEAYDGATERNDLVQQLKAGVQVRTLDWMTVGLGGDVLARRSNDAQVEYVDGRVMLGTTIFY